MATRDVPPPRLPNPPEDLPFPVQMYLQDLTRALEVFIEQTNNPGVMRGSQLTLTDLPTSTSGLETGALYNDSGTVKIVT